MSTTLPSISKRPWRRSEKILFRFFFLYFVLYIFPFPIDFLPWLGDYASEWNGNFWQYIVAKVGSGILNISSPISSAPTGSGDMTYNYVEMFTKFSLSLIGCIIWTALDYRRREYRRLFTLLHIGLRYYLAFILLVYGISKLFTNQFSSLSLFDLIKTYGDSSPMGLMWNFMEFSDAYTFFSGFGEALAGLLLLFRKSTKLGSLVAIAVMTNVVMMNFSYDIPVKLYSSHLLLMAIWILLPYSGNLVRFFILNRPTEADRHSPYFSKRKFKIIGHVLKGILILYVIGSFVNRSAKGYNTYGKGAAKPELYGIYNVTEFIKNYDTVPPSLTETERWRTFVVNSSRAYGYKTMEDKITYLSPEIDTTAHRLLLTSWQDSTETYRFKYHYKDSILTLKGSSQKDSLFIQLRQIDHTKFLILNRGFNWINEVPYNR